MNKADTEILKLLDKHLVAASTNLSAAGRLMRKHGIGYGVKAKKRVRKAAYTAYIISIHVQDEIEQRKL